MRSLGIALAAGFAGTAAMTLSQALEQKLRGSRRPRTAASVAENATGIEAETKEGRDAMSSSLHWLYGTGLGAALVPLEGVSEPYRSLSFLGGVYGAGLAWESIADKPDAPSRRDATSMGTDFMHHLVYAGTATLAYNGLRALAEGDQDAGSARSLFASWNEDSGSEESGNSGDRESTGSSTSKQTATTNA